MPADVTGKGPREQLAVRAGKAFKGDSIPLPISVRKSFVNMRLSMSRKAGTISNQKSAAATAWITLNAASDFRAYDMAWTWTGYLLQW